MCHQKFARWWTSTAGRRLSDDQMINITFNSTDKRLAAFLERKRPQIVEQLADTLDTLMLELQRRVQQKLSGEVLQHRSGKLLGSVVKEPVQVSSNRISGRVTAAGGPAFYGRIQEAGGTRQYEILPKNKKALAFFGSGSVGGAIAASNVPFTPGKSTVRGLYTRSGANRGSLKPGRLGTFGQLGGVVVRKVIHPPIVARPFMRTSLLELQGEIIEKLRAAAMRGLRA